MSEIAALAGLLATVSLIACAILIYHAVLLQAQVNKLQEIVRQLGVHMRVPVDELPPPPFSVDEYAPDAIVDVADADREWELPRNWRRNLDV